MNDEGAKPPVKRTPRKPAVPKLAPVLTEAAPAAPVIPAAAVLSPVPMVSPAAIATATEGAGEQVVRAGEAMAEAMPTPAEVIEEVEAVASPAVESNNHADEPDALAQAEEGTKIMATVTPTPTETAGIASEKMQSLFGDMGARYKASLEKSTKLGEEMVDLAKGNIEAVVASARVAAKGTEVLGQEAADYTKRSFESAVAAMKSFASVKSPTELFQLQSDFAKASFDSAVAEASRFSESMMKLAGDVAQPISTRYSVAAEKIKSAAL